MDKSISTTTGKRLNRGPAIYLFLPLLFFPGQNLRAEKPKEVLSIDGLHQPVEINKDRWGISHIYAQNATDLFFAQGFNVASDRLFQLELWRRQATGTAAEILGRRALKRDIGARLLKFRGDLKDELAFYHPQGEEIIAAFVRGINAYIDRVRRRPELLPLEFRLLGFEPGRWTPEVVISRHNGLFRNAGDEVSLARAVNLLGPEKLAGLLDLHPGNPSLVPAEGLDLNSIPSSILELYRAARSPVEFEPEDLVRIALERETFDTAGFPRPLRFLIFRPFSSSYLSHFLSRPVSRVAARLDVSGIEQKHIFPYPEERCGPDVGSNNWAVSGRRTRSGRPLLANDPHRALQVPSLRYWVHLVAPGWNVIGGGEPALPGVSIGHNEDGAWGLTIFSADQEDLYVYDTDPTNPNRYRYGSGWEEMELVREEIAVRGEAPYTAILKYTRHGPVLYENEERHTAVALRAAWLETGCAPYLTSLRLDQARTWQEFRAAALANRTPSENLIWADKNGDIGWQATGLTPIRKNWSGLLPVPGDGRYEWAGYIPPEDLPSVLNPDGGFVATANEDNLPPGYPYQVGYIWADPFRFLRISEVLSSGTQWTIRDMASLQQDVLSIPARRLVPLLKRLDLREPRLRAARRLLEDWDFLLTPESAAAAVYVAWQRVLLKKLNALLLPEQLRAGLPGRSLMKAIRELEMPNAAFGSSPEEARDRLLADALAAAVDILEKMFGHDMARWRYGDTRFHHVLFRHPLSPIVREDIRRLIDIGPLPLGGSGETVNNTSGADNQASGATFRIVADLSDWDRALGTNSPGQSGDPKNPHYSDLFGMWAAGRYFPVYFSRNKIRSAAEKTVILRPAR